MYCSLQKRARILLKTIDFFTVFLMYMMDVLLTIFVGWDSGIHKLLTAAKLKNTFW